MDINHHRDFVVDQERRMNANPQDAVEDYHTAHLNIDFLGVVLAVLEVQSNGGQVFESARMDMSANELPLNNLSMVETPEPVYPLFVLS
jgi:hypothetical protein